MKPKVLVTREVFDETLNYLAGHCEVDSNQSDVALDPEALARRLADRSGLMCALTDRVDARLIERCPGLKAVANIAVGYNNIDLAACTARGIMATNTPGVLDDSTADLAWTLMLGAARRITELERRVRAGEWTGWRLKQWLGVDVHHATLGIFGLGRIGQAIARRAAGFEMKVLYHNRKRVAPDIEKRVNATYAGKDELLKQSDFVILQVPYSPQTHHMIGARELKLMKPTAILVNSTRGGVVDDAALIAALKAGTIRAAGLD
ncbi:MAG TPA: D-glycerate dehydrogenase, partial [Burkholderiales bacterium]|nr:D-glycerate dehydrogenase [Burkholderiales bacterium]